MIRIFWSILLLCGALSSYKASANTPTNEDRKAVLLNQIHFCNEYLPLHQQPIARRFSLTLRRINRTFFNSVKGRASRFFGVIDPILQRHNIPSDFKYLAVIESQLLAGAKSPKGAGGYWQFMPQTARDMGLIVDAKTDEREDLHKSTAAACRYLRQLYQQFGSWTLVAAAYNAGPGSANAYIRRSGSENYYVWRSKEETRQYLYRIIAAKEWFNDPERLEEIMSLINNKGFYSDIQKHFVPKNNQVLMPDFERPALIVKSPKVEELEIVEAPKYSFDFNKALKTRILNATIPQKGQTWVFEVTENKRFGEVSVYAKDRLYAVVESYDATNKTVVLKSSQMYSSQRNQVYTLPLTCVEAAKQMGIEWPLNNTTSEVYWKKF